MEFLRQITGNQARNQPGRTWETPAAEEVLRVAGTNLSAK